MVEFAEQDNTSNYVFEIAWPISHIVRDTMELLPTIKSGKTMEFEIQFADNNTIGEPVRDNVIAWNNNSDNGESWKNTHLWGFLRLAGSPATSVDKITNAASIKVYPNPAKNFIIIESSSLFSEIFISNMLGQTVMERSFASGEINTSIDISNLEKDGFYFVSIITENGRESKKIVIRK